MSAICGLVDFDARISPGEVERMSESMPGLFDGGTHIRCHSHAAFAFLLHRNAIEDEYEAQPCVLGDGRLFASSARLHNRIDLLRALAVPRGEAERTADGTLVRLAFERWGESCFQHLVGQFSLAVWDPRNHRLFLGCDHMGETSLFVTRRGTRYAFATDPTALFALSDCPRVLNEEAYSDHLLGKYTPFASTLFVGVERLPSATAQRVTARETRTIDYWSLESLPRLRWRNPEERFEAFAEVMEASTRSRLRATGEVGLMLSGGLDSGLVAAFAAPLLRAVGRPLHTYTIRPSSGAPTRIPSSRVGDETPFVEALAARHPNLQTLFSPTEPAHFLVDLDETFAALHMPPLVPAQWALIRAGMATLADRGVTSLLRAQRGNHTVSWWGVRPWLEMLLRGQWSRLFADWHAYGLRTSRARALRRCVGEIISGAKDALSMPVRQPRDPVDTSLLHPQWVEAVGLRDRLMEHLASSFRKSPYWGREHRLSVFRNAGYRRHQDFFQRLLAPLGLEGSDVTADRRLVEFSLGLEDADFRHQGWDRALARFGAEDCLPELIRYRETRGLQPIDDIRTSWRHEDLIRATLSDFRSDAAVSARLNVDAMDSLWTALLAQRGAGNAWLPGNISHELGRLNRLHTALSAGRFLQWLRKPLSCTARRSVSTAVGNAEQTSRSGYVAHGRQMTRRDDRT